MQVINDVLNEINTNPSAMIWYGAFIFIILLVNWIWREIINPLLKEHTKKKITKAFDEKEQERIKLEVLYKVNRDQLHKEMQRMIKKCNNKGYRTVHDTSEFGVMLTDYYKIQGNHDGDILKHDFMKIPTQDTLELPIPEGYENIFKKNKYDEIYDVLQRRVVNMKSIKQGLDLEASHKKRRGRIGE